MLCSFVICLICVIFSHRALYRFFTFTVVGALFDNLIVLVKVYTLSLPVAIPYFSDIVVAIRILGYTDAVRPAVELVIESARIHGDLHIIKASDGLEDLAATSDHNPVFEVAFKYLDTFVAVVCDKHASAIEAFSVPVTRVVSFVCPSFNE